MNIKFFLLLFHLFLGSSAYADDPATTNVDWQFNGQRIQACANSQKVSIPQGMIGTYVGMINMSWYNGSQGFDYTKNMDLHFAIFLGANGIERMWILPKDPDHPDQPQPMEFPDLGEMAKAGVCAYSGYDADHGFYIQLQDPEFGAQRTASKITYRIEVKPKEGDKDHITFSLHKFMWSPALFVIVVVPIVPILPSSDYLFENISLHRYTYLAKHN